MHVVQIPQAGEMCALFLFSYHDKTAIGVDGVRLQKCKKGLQ